MAGTLYNNRSTFSRFNLDEDLSDIQIFISEYRRRVYAQLAREQTFSALPFISFHEHLLENQDKKKWLKDNQDRFFKDSPNQFLKIDSFLSEMGFITSMIYSPDGEFIVVGHSTGLVQAQQSAIMVDIRPPDDDDETNEILAQFKATIEEYYRHEKDPKLWYYMFSRSSQQSRQRRDYTWVKNNNHQFLEETPNKVLQNRWFSTECGHITALAFSKDGERIVVGHASGLVQMRHGHSGIVMATLRNIQFPAKPVFALEFSRTESRVCYAACTDGAIYRIEIPIVDLNSLVVPEYCIRSDPTLEWLNTQFYGSPGVSMSATPFISQRSAALSLGITADSTRMVVGYGDTSIKIFDMKTQEPEQIFKVHKLRLQFVPKKLQRVHCGQVCAVRCHNDNPYTYATAGWDDTLRIWDIRCKVGCMMTFEGVKICHDSIDLNRNQAISGSWQPSEALVTWDLVARKRLNIIRVQNRRPDIDGEYIYACRFWKSSQFNRKGKYGIIGGSGTGCVEVINLHNRYITCSYPAPGTVLAIASYDDRIAFGGTSPVFNIVSFRDPKHEPYKPDEETPYNYSEHPVTLFERYLATSPLSSATGAESFVTGRGENEGLRDESKICKKSQSEMDGDKLGKKSRAEMGEDQLGKKSRGEMGEDQLGKKSRGEMGEERHTLTDISQTPMRKSKVSTLPGAIPPPK